jgi:biopolymer transport protein TolR
MRIRRSRQISPVIPAVPMANLVLLLVTFFVGTRHVDVDKATVALPDTRLRLEAPRAAAVVSITENGQLRVSDGESASSPVAGPEDVLSFATGLVAADPERPFLLKADRALPYRTVDRIVDVLKQAGVEAVFLLSDQQTAPVVEP